MSNIEAVIATNRFGLGARPGEIKTVGSHPRGWLYNQLHQADSILINTPALPDSETVIANRIKAKNKSPQMGYTEQNRQNAAKIMRQSVARLLQDEIRFRNEHATRTRVSFLERWVRFWSNHFTVSTRNPEIMDLAGSFEREAIRPFALSHFNDLLVSSSLHPAMLIYLDNHRSVGPNIWGAERYRRGLNENLAREILELHTLGVDGGYTQADVTAFAKALTGWTVSAPPFSSKHYGQTMFIKRMHEPGKQWILQREYDGTSRQAKNVLKTLAHHPSTATHIATKLARHFISDHPPQKAVDSLRTRFLTTDGNLMELAKTLINLPDSWSTSLQKFKRPDELMISTARILGFDSIFHTRVDKIYQSLGQIPFSAPAPDGWSDMSVDWIGSDSIYKRLEWANAVSRREASIIRPISFLGEAVGHLVSQATRQAVLGAGSPSQGLTLALMSPEFQRR